MSATGTPRRRRVLVFQESWGRGGIETCVMNLVRGLDPQAYEIELLSAYDWDTGYDAELAERGIRRTAAFPGRMPGLVRRFVRGTRLWKRLLDTSGADIVHVNAMNGMTLAYAVIARQRGVPVRVVHSHNNDFGDGARTVKLLFHRLGKALWGGAATMRLACSQAAGTYLFDRRDFAVVPNGIDTQRFAFDPAARAQVRDALGIAPGTLVLGSIGRISHQKNPLFSLRVLAELRKTTPDACLVLVGDGELVADAHALARELGVGDRYRHVGSVPNPEDYCAAMDLFLMPSIYEGLGYALVEAQCAGLPCVVSEAIQDEAIVTDLVRRVPLAQGAPGWADAIRSAIRSRRDTRPDRGRYAPVVAAAGYAVERSVEAVERAYRQG